MSDEPEERAGDGTADGGQVDGKTERIDEFVGVLDDPVVIRVRGEAMSAEQEKQYLAEIEPHHIEEAEEELASRGEAGADVDGMGNETSPAGDRYPNVSYKPSERRMVGVLAAQEAEWQAAAGGEEAAGGGEIPGDGEPAGAQEWSGEPAGGEEALVAKLSKVHVAAMSDLLDALGQGIAEVKAVVPRVGGEELAKLSANVKALEELIRIQKSDGERKREVRGKWWRWPLRGVVAVAVFGLVLGGAAIQSRWSVVDDGTHGWKEIVWERHGMKVAECIDRAAKSGKGVACAVTARVR